MIDHLKHMAIFARVVDEGSFRAAADSVGLAPSRVSQTVSDLEAYLGVTLLYRTTRKIALTNEGRLFYARVVDMVRSAETGLNELNALSLDPVGALRVSLPAFMASSNLTAAIATFVRQHPNVALTLVYTDYTQNLLEDGFDLSIRAGWLDDSTMMSRKLGEAERALVVGQAYMTGREPPQRPSDLEGWDWVRYKHRADTTAFVSDSGETEEVTGNAQIEVDSVDAMFNFVRYNAGVSILPSHLAEQGVASGELVQLLPNWKPRPLGIFAVWPDTSRRENLTLLC
jgi:DNA-binding transcriptional LysR family regulator